MPLIENIVGKIDNKLKQIDKVMVCEDHLLINYLTCKLRDNYPAVNQNGLSDRTLPLVEVKCVGIETTVPPPAALPSQ